VKTAKLFALLLILLGLVSLYFLRSFSPVVRLGAASIGMIVVIKTAALIWQRSDGARFSSRLGIGLFLLAWPGISVSGFTERKELDPATGSRFFEAWMTFLFGLGILVAASLIGRGDSTFLNYVALFSVLLIIHLGLLEVIADGIRLLGFWPRSLFDRPYLAVSLRDFWSVRWNRAFVDMNKIFIKSQLSPKVPLAILTFSIFAVSGFLHEMGISYADGISWGRPMFYFIIQGAGMELEKRYRFPRALVWAWILLPSPFLFTPDFTNLFIGSLSRALADFATGLRVEDILKYGLILGGTFNFLVLCASVQVPGKLGWRSDFQKLTSLNRKVFWTYGVYIFAVIVFMAIVSFLLSRQNVLDLQAPALLWTLFIALFWWARVLTDFFYMSHADWPHGPLFAIGHICLTTLFISMACLYTALSLLIYTFMK
jgi:hypothetical protein